MKPLESAIQQLALARESLGHHDRSIARVEEELRAKYYELYHGRQSALESVADLDAKVRDLAIEHYKSDPANKRPAAGVCIRVTSKTTFVYDLTKAFAWALKSCNSALQLNTRVFEGVCKVAETRPRFVKATTEEVLIAAIDKELPIGAADSPKKGKPNA